MTFIIYNLVVEDGNEHLVLVVGQIADFASKGRLIKLGLFLKFLDLVSFDVYIFMAVLSLICLEKSDHLFLLPCLFTEKRQIEEETEPML